MALDSTDEILSHFIGMFNLTVEQMRLRDDYEDFTAERRQAELNEIEARPGPETDPKLDPDKVEIEPTPLPLDPAPQASAPREIPAEPKTITPVIPALEVTTPASDDPETLETPGRTIRISSDEDGGRIVISGGRDGREIRIEQDAEFQGSVYSATWQYAFLSDNDVLGDGAFRFLDDTLVKTEIAVDAAIALQALSGPLPNLDALRDYDSVEALAEALSAHAPVSLPGAEIFRFEGEAALDTIVNGEISDDMPVWGDYLPAFHRTEDEDTAERDSAPAEWDRSEARDGTDGHTIITGGNLVVNDAQILSTWLDAPYIAIGGTAIDLSVISQVAVVSDLDIGQSATPSGDTEVVHAAQITTESNTAPWLEGVRAVSDGPSVMTLDKISGDLIVANFVEQRIDVNDLDHIGSEITAASTFWSLGDNEVVNIADLRAYASHYDVILVGGDKISVDMLFQTQVLMDDDRLDVGQPSLPGLAAASSAPGAFDDVTQSGRAVDGQSSRQNDVSGFDLPDGPEPVSAPKPSDPMPSEPSTGGDNLVMNLARLKTIGEDTHAEISNSLAEIVADQTTSAEALEAALLSDPMLAGLEQVRALQIEGNLVQVNVVEQVSVLSDQDDLLIDGGVPADAEVVAGSNAMLNAAEVIKAGVDSVVMARTEGYSDLLLHQASLIDAPDGPDAGGSEYINEALVALFDDVPNTDDISEQVNSLVGTQDIAASDPLHSMLA